MPNILGPIVVTAALDVGAMIMNLAGLSYLGLGVVPPTPEWGFYDERRTQHASNISMDCIGARSCYFITVIIFNLLGDTVRDILDPKQTRRTLNDNVQKMKGIFSGRKKERKNYNLIPGQESFGLSTDELHKISLNQVLISKQYSDFYMMLK